jgi:hypothetical protein
MTTGGAALGAGIDAWLNASNNSNMSASGGSGGGGGKSCKNSGGNTREVSSRKLKNHRINAEAVKEDFVWTQGREL